MGTSASRSSSPSRSSPSDTPPSSSPSTWRDRKANMTQPLNTPIVDATVVNVTHVHREESNQNAVTHTQYKNRASNTEVVSRADHEIYYSHLLTKKRGSPLWIPGPGMQLPIEYRRQGISIGDVGIITESGGFDFLFNIFLPADHPIHVRGVPESFCPLDPTQLEIETGRIYGRNTYLTSSSVRTTGVNSSDLNFESTEREAAILTMPEGALTQNLLNNQVIRKCIAKNARSWFEYARDTRGRIVENGDIRVVVGWDKVCSWGIATSKSTSGQSVSLAFKVDDKAGTSRVYCWECIGSGGGRVGPHEDEIADLRQKGDGAPQNQCVFVRTMDFSLAGDIGDDFFATAVHLPVSDKTKGSKAQQSSGGRVSLCSQSSSTKGGSHDRESIKFDTTERGIVHPTATLHKLLLEKYPNATMAITQDADWISVLTDEDTHFPEPEELCARLSKSYEVYESDGIVTLRKKSVHPHKGAKIVSPPDTHRHAQSGKHISKNMLSSHSQSFSVQGGSRGRMATVPQYLPPAPSASRYQPPPPPLPKQQTPSTDFATLSQKYIAMLANKPADPVITSTAPTTTSLAKLDAPVNVPQVSNQFSEIADTLASSLTSKFRNLSDFMTSPRQSSSVQRDPHPHQSAMLDAGRVKDDTNLPKLQDHVQGLESRKDRNSSITDQHTPVTMVATASPEPKTEKKPTCGVHHLLPQQAIIYPQNVTNFTGNYQNISLASSFPLDDVLLWTNQDPRESVLFHSWGIFYRFKTIVHTDGQFITYMSRSIQANREDCIAKLEWGPDGGLGRVVIGKQALSMVDLTQQDHRMNGARSFTGPDGFAYRWQPSLNGTDVVLQDTESNIIAAFRPTRPTRYQIGDVYGELQFYRDAGRCTLMHPQMQDVVTLTAMLYRFCAAWNL